MADDADPDAEGLRSDYYRPLEVGDVLDRLRDGDAGAVEEAIEYLEADPWTYRSGYAKGRAMRYLRQRPLDARQRRRLDRVVLAQIDAGDRMELRETVDLARHLGPQGLRGPLVERLASGDRGRARRALIVLAALRSPRLADRDLAACRRVVVELAGGRDREGRIDRLPILATFPPETRSYLVEDLRRRDRRLLRRLAVRFWSLEWEDQLLRVAEGSSPDRVAALGVLDALPRRHGDANEERFAAARKRSRMLADGT
jgi:hypothetical protein